MKKSVLLLLLFLLGCAHKPNKINIAVSLTDNNGALKISGLDRAIIAEISRDTTTGLWQGLLPVYKMPVDTDMKDYQEPQPGTYRVSDSVLFFTPDTPFNKNQDYFLRFYQQDKGVDAWHIVRSKSRPGASSYTDLIFKY